MKKIFQTTLLQSSVSKAKVAAACNLFIHKDKLTSESRVIQKRCKGRWINKGYELLPELREDKTVFILVAFAASFLLLWQNKKSL